MRRSDEAGPFDRLKGKLVGFYLETSRKGGGGIDSV